MSRHGIQLAPVPDVVEVGESAAPDPTLLDRVVLLLRSAWRRKWIAGAVLLVGVDASVVYYRLEPSVYRVEAVLAQRQPPPSLRAEALRDGPAQSAREMVHSQENLLALIGEANVLAPPSERPGSADLRQRSGRSLSDRPRQPDSNLPDALVRRLDEALEVTTRGETITLAIEWPDPEQAYRLVKAASRRLLEARREQAAETLDEIVKPAELPKRPVSPDPLRVFGLGGLASLLLAVVVAAATERRSGRVAEHGQVESARRGRGSGPVKQVAIERSVARRTGSADRAFQELWFAVARKRWRSLVLVPADEGESAAGIAASLADVGRRLRGEPVTFFIVADPIDYGSAARIFAALDSTRQEDRLATAPSGQVIVAIQPVIAEPLGLAATEGADLAVVCVEVGHTRLTAARRTIELIGRERTAGCLVVHPASGSDMSGPAATAAPGGALAQELQQMWRSLMRGSWTSIVVVPTDARIPQGVVVGALRDAAAFHHMERFQIVDAAGASPAQGERLAQQVASAVAGGARAVVAVDSLMESLGGIPLVRDADAALLVVRLGVSNYDSVQSTVDIVGRERILGTVALPR